MFVIYRAVNKINGKCYVGFTTRTPEIRWKEHLVESRGGSSTRLHKAIRKHGSDCWTLDVLEEGWTPNIGLEIREPYWISILMPEYNMTTGGDGVIGYSHTNEFRDKQRLRMMGVRITTGRKATEAENTANRLRGLGNKWSLGIKHTPEQCQEKSILMKGNTRGIHSKGPLGITYKIVLCPKCQKVGRGGAMVRYHFDNCKGNIS